MIIPKPYFLALFLLGIALSLQAHTGPTRSGQETNSTAEVNFRNGCSNAVTQIDQQINNVRARLTTGGDMWWDGNVGRYIVPKVAPGIPEVSSIFASGIWIGGKDPGGNLKLAAQTYGRSTGNFDYYPGPLYKGDPNYPGGGALQDPRRGTIEPDTCANWDKFFVVKGVEIEEHIRNWRVALEEGQIKLDREDIPESILGWPARGNPFFESIHQFKLPNSQQGLADFWDQNLNGMYEPEKGDYPILGIRHCWSSYPKAAPDEMIFWIYNDTGNEHRNSGSAQALQMEIQGIAFSFKTNDDLNNMTFQRHKLINRSIERLDSTYFGLWVDADLGCSTDDYIGCDIDRNLAYTYNADAVDGTNGCVCDAGMATYCEEIPIVGIDLFRTPQGPPPDDIFPEHGGLGMTSFTYYNNVSPDIPSGQTGPQTTQEYYNLLSGKWKDGTPFTYGGSGYQSEGEEVSYVFSDPPNQTGGWSMCEENLGLADRRTIQSSGPITLLPGAVDEMIFGVIWVASQNYPCPSLDRLLKADDMAQNLFNGCIDLIRGPDAPAVDWIELDQEIVAVFSNDTLFSNNAFEAFEGRGLNVPEEEDGIFLFEGYKLYQFSGPDVTLDDVDDPSKVRLVYQVDKKNDIGKIFNWEVVQNNEHPLTPDLLYEPILKVDGNNQGIRHTFSIKEDQFADGDRRLVNHKKYYFAAVAYAYNNYKEFDPSTNVYNQGQQSPYWEGLGNVGDGENGYYTVIPRKILDRQLYASYGPGALVTRIDGIGTGRNFLDITDETRLEIEALVRAGDFEPFSDKVTYKSGMAPIDVTIYNPLNVLDGEYELTFIDDDMDDDELDAPVYWTLRNLTNSTAPVLTSEQAIEELNEQIIAEYGFSITVEQVNEPGSAPFEDASNGAIGYAEEYADPDATPWLFGINDGLVIHTGNPVLDGNMYNYAVIDDIENDNNNENALDPNHALSAMGNGFFIPYYFCDWRAKPNGAPYLSPAWKNSDEQNIIVHHRTSLASLNNVDIVFTSDKSLWSRCVIVETATPDHREAVNATPEDDYIADPANGGQSDMFDLRAHPSVSKEAGADGLPLVEENPLEGEEEGMGWFPGYAIDVETGLRLNIFFGENSAYNDKMPGSSGNGNDMMFNPSSELYLPPTTGVSPTILNYPAGGQHYIYVTDQPYDRCAEQLERFSSVSDIRKLAPLEAITWAGFIVIPPNITGMTSYEDGLIPADVTVKLRVNNPYQVKLGTGEFNGYPSYRFALEGQQALPLDEIAIEEALKSINIIPNPYYGFSAYEGSAVESIVKISNLPAVCTVTIYTLDGQLVRQLNRNEKGAVVNRRNRAINQAQIIPDIEWDLKNNRGLPIASGVYLIHITAPGLGERTLKWFGINRQFEP